MSLHPSVFVLCIFRQCVHGKLGAHRGVLVEQQMACAFDRSAFNSEFSHFRHRAPRRLDDGFGVVQLHCTGLLVLAL